MRNHPSFELIVLRLEEWERKVENNREKVGEKIEGYNMLGRNNNNGMNDT